MSAKRKIAYENISFDLKNRYFLRCLVFFHLENENNQNKIKNAADPHLMEIHYVQNVVAIAHYHENICTLNKLQRGKR